MRKHYNNSIFISLLFVKKEAVLLFELVRLGIGHSKMCSIPKVMDWQEVFRLTKEQGVTAIVLDGINRCYKNEIEVDIDFQTKMEWIGLVAQMEQQYKLHEKHLRELAAFYKKHSIKMMVLKGYGLSKNYNEPSYRPCGDMDIYLFGEQEKADHLIHDELDIVVDKSHHHHTVFQFQGETIENHYDFLNIHVRPTNKRIETKLKSLVNHNLETNDIGFVSAKQI